MKLRNKKTGEIGNLLPYGCEDGKMWVWVGNISRPEYRYNSLAELNEDWEDAPEEPKEYWYVGWSGEVCCSEIHDEMTNKMKQIGNYFETKEEAERALKKLEAWKRLKDKGFRFDGYDSGHNYNKELCGQAYFKAGNFWFDIIHDLDLLFGGKNE